MTNRAWHIEPQQLRQSGLKQLYVVNDFAAAIAAIPGLEDSHLKIVQTGTASAGPILLLGPGTGLGAAAAVRVGRSWRVLPSEAGHMSAASSNAKIVTLVECARIGLGRVSWERLLSGAGLAWLDAELNGTPPATPATVVQRALQGDEQALETLRMFSH